MKGEALSVRIAANRPVVLYVIDTSLVLGLGVLALALVTERNVSGAPDAVLLGLVAFAAIVLARMIYLTCWSVAGAEVLSSRDGGLVVERCMLGRTLSVRRYAFDRIEDLRLSPVSYWALGFQHPFWWTASSMGFGVGPIAFTYEGTRVRVAEGLRGEDQVAQDLLVLLKKWSIEAEGIAVTNPARPT